MLFQSLRDVALERANDFFASLPSASRLDASELARNCPRACAGWQLVVNVAGAETNLFVWVDSEYPFTPPRTQVPADSHFMQNPHVESDGRVCFVAGAPSYAHRAPEQVLEWVLDQTIKALSVSTTEAPAEFINEFQAYWDRQSTNRDHTSLVLLSPGGLTRRIYYRQSKTFVVFAEDAKSLRRWFANNGLETRFDPQVGLFIRLAEPVSPHAIPATSRGFASFLRERDPFAYEMLVQCIPTAESPLPVLIGFETQNGTALATVVLHEPVEGTGPGKRRSRVQDGWSSRKRMPRVLLAMNYLGNVEMSRLPTRRFDKEWLDYRTGNMNSPHLSESHVCLIGCGALGSNLAYILARAGVAKLTLIDGDVLTWDNVGRHLLGAEYVGMTKAAALRKFLLKQLPHLDIDAFAGKWQAVYEEKPSIVLNANVIVSTTGDWACDELLNLVARTTSSMPPTLFGWLEEFGGAGQALAVLRDGGCLSCGMTPNGRFKHAATNWDESVLRRAGACGEFFQPFGITELGPVTDTLARLVIDVLLGKVMHSELRSWLGAQAIISGNKGKYSDSVVPLFQKTGVNELMHHVQSWGCDPDCNLCRMAS